MILRDNIEIDAIGRHNRLQSSYVDGEPESSVFSLAFQQAYKNSPTTWIADKLSEASDNLMGYQQELVSVEQAKEEWNIELDEPEKLSKVRHLARLNAFNQYTDNAQAVARNSDNSSFYWTQTIGGILAGSLFDPALIVTTLGVGQGVKTIASSYKAVSRALHNTNPVIKYASRVGVLGTAEAGINVVSGLAIADNRNYDYTGKDAAFDVAVGAILGTFLSGWMLGSGGDRLSRVYKNTVFFSKQTFDNGIKKADVYTDKLIDRIYKPAQKKLTPDEKAGVNVRKLLREEADNVVEEADNAKRVAKEESDKVKRIADKKEQLKNTPKEDVIDRLILEQEIGDEAYVPIKGEAIGIPKEKVKLDFEFISGIKGLKPLEIKTAQVIDFYDKVLGSVDSGNLNEAERNVLTFIKANQLNSSISHEYLHEFLNLQDNFNGLLKKVYEHTPVEGVDVQQAFFPKIEKEIEGIIDTIAKNPSIPQTTQGLNEYLVPFYSNLSEAKNIFSGRALTLEPIVPKVLTPESFNSTIQKGLDIIDKIKPFKVDTSIIKEGIKKIVQPAYIGRLKANDKKLKESVKKVKKSMRDDDSNFKKAISEAPKSVKKEVVDAAIEQMIINRLKKGGNKAIIVSALTKYEYSLEDYYNKYLELEEV